MTRIALIFLVIAVTSAAATTSYFLYFDLSFSDQTEELSNSEQRIRDFFKPATKRDLHSGQEMRPRW
ncbi:DUF2749 domain-containing protein [Ensifer sp. P24N7]|uniref:DUF2749 domain-containing protein n=1 Tax=Sinorhizobium sp. P24N7 TaxID=3348358 RepID=UPI0035F41C94